MSGVDIDDIRFECSCNIPLLHKFPCEHLIAACSNQDYGANITFHNFCSDWYSTEKYQRSYAPCFRYVKDKRFWKPYEGVFIEPPVFKRKPGRTWKVRLKSKDESVQEGKSKNKCGNCKEQGHYRNRCPNNPRRINEGAGPSGA